MLSQLVFPQTRSVLLVRLVFAAVSCFAAFLLRLALDPVLKEHSPLVLFGLAVAVSAIRGGFWPGMAATLLSAIGALYFFPPQGTFLTIVSEYRVTVLFQMLVFIAVGSSLSWLGGEVRRLRWMALELAAQRNQILESINDGFLALDREWKFLYVNRIAAQTLHTSPAEVSGKPSWDLAPEWRGGVVERELRNAMSGHAPVRFEYGSAVSGRWFEFHVNRTENGGLTVYFSDITARKAAEQKLRDTLKERDEALAKVRLLTGLLPICAGCKRIRDEQGNWNQMEAYICNHSEVQFSHGLCPECVKKYWTD